MPLSWGPSIIINGNAHILAEVNKVNGGWRDKQRLRRGRTKARAYEWDVYRTLNKIASRRKEWTGFIVLSEIAKTGKKLWIVPWTGARAGAKANASDIVHARNRRRDAATNRCLEARVPASQITGDTLQYSAQSWRGQDSIRRWNEKTLSIDVTDPDNKYVEPDEALVHELVHELRGLSGLLCPIRMDDDYHLREEFYAIVVENIYRSERGRPLRADHGRTFRVLHLDEKQFYFRFGGPIEQFCAEMPTFTRRLSRVDGKFNPLRVHYSS